MTADNVPSNINDDLHNAASGELVENFLPYLRDHSSQNLNASLVSEFEEALSIGSQTVTIDSDDTVSIDSEETVSCDSV